MERKEWSLQKEVRYKSRQMSVAIISGGALEIIFAIMYLARVSDATLLIVWGIILAMLCGIKLAYEDMVASLRKRNISE